MLFTLVTGASHGRCISSGVTRCQHGQRKKKTLRIAPAPWGSPTSPLGPALATLVANCGARGNPPQK
ncbi:hypothetical protein Bpfe_029646, partial [Biomphalaria pfeifferi]